jgi:hypothetical protein
MADKIAAIKATAADPTPPGALRSAVCEDGKRDRCDEQHGDDRGRQ